MGKYNDKYDRARMKSVDIKHWWEKPKDSNIIIARGQIEIIYNREDTVADRHLKHSVLLFVKEYMKIKANQRFQNMSNPSIGGQWSEKWGLFFITLSGKGYISRILNVFIIFHFQ